MTSSIIASPPSGLLRALLRAPIWLYRMQLGWLLGNRFLLLQHKGRKSGRVHETVIEVVKHDPQSQTFHVVSGWGPRSDWYLNIKADPEVSIAVGGRRMHMRAATVPHDEAREIMTEYSYKHPLAFRELTSLFLSERLQPGPEAGRRLADMMPMVAFHVEPQHPA